MKEGTTKVHFFPYETRLSLGHETTNHNGGVGTAKAKASGCSLAASLGCKIHLAILVSSALYRVTRPISTEKHTNTVGPPHTPHRVLIGFYPSCTRKGIY
jgi:hypothetical protein